MKRNSAYGLLAAAALCLTLSACTSAGSGGSANSPSPGGATGSTSTAGSTGGATTGGGSTGSSTGGGSTGGSTGSTTGGSTTGSSTTGGSTAAAGPAACTGSQITVGVGPNDGAAGHIAVGLLFTNVTGAPCTLYGYPGVAMLDSADHQVAQATRTLRGMMGGAAPGATSPASVVVPAHGHVSARLEWSDVPQGGLSQCPTYAGVLVTPPGTKTSTRIISFQPVACTVQIHPVVPGDNGNQQ
ncbi:hypothetical protein ABH931_007728 [Streptacidiphilus sp. MAP12-33]|uniref:DUF4232 domain-containing protein n=1 Tax=Streptacidiphilus sp. MAP12-33 TaxID=3156266 RepID=UPI003515AE85